MRRLPDFVIIGAQKAASTEIMRALARHADCTLHPDEQHFFRDPYYEASTLDQFACSLPETSTRRFGIKCPDYLGHPEVAPRLAQDLESPQLIACLRNPIDRAVSAYYWYVRWGVLPLHDANRGLTALLDGDDGLPPFAEQVLTYGLYAQHLTRTLEHFGRGDLHVVLHDDLCRDYAGTISDVLGFLDLPPAETHAAPIGANRGVYAPSRLRLLRTRNRYLVRHDLEGRDYRIVKPTALWPNLFSKVVAATDRWILARAFPSSAPPLSPDVRARLEAYYADDVKLLEKLLGKDLRCWRIAS